MPLIRATMIVGLVLGLAGCQTGATASSLPAQPVLPSILIPYDVHRIAVLYPKPASPELAEAYNRLEGATFQVKMHRPYLKIVDRAHLPILLGEHRFQLTASVADDSAIHVGRLLGVDSVLIYRIDGPSFRDRLWAQRSGDLPPVTVTSKLIRVESGEVLYHQVVVARIKESPVSGWSLADHLDYQRLSREAMDRGIMQTVLDLERAFERETK